MTDITLDFVGPGAQIALGAAARAEAAAETAVAAADEALESANASAPNLVSDFALRRAVAMKATAGGVGVADDTDAANPWGGGSLADAGGLIRLTVRLSDTPFKIGDHINARIYFTATGVVSVDFYCATEAGTLVGTPAVQQAGANGVNDKTLGLTIAATTVKVVVEIGGVGAAGAKVFAKAFAYYPTTPQFTEAAALADNPPTRFPGAGGKIALFGDSVTGDSIDVLRNDQGRTVASSGSYQINDGLSIALAAEVLNVGFGGTTLARRGDDANYDAFSMAALATAIATNTWTAQDAALTVLAASPYFDDNTAELTRLKAIDWSTMYGAVFCFGTNDYGASEVALGSDSDTTGATFKGAVTFIANTLLAAYPHLRLLFVTPAYRDRFEGFGITAAITGNTTLTVTAVTGTPLAVGQVLYEDEIDTRRVITGLGTGTGGTGTYTVTSGANLISRAMIVGDGNDGDNYNNAQTLKLTDYAAAIKSQAARNHVACLDLYGESGINKYTAARLTADGLHPTVDDGIDWWVDRLSRGIERLL